VHVIAFDAHHGERVVDTRFEETLTASRGRLDVGDTPRSKLVVELIACVLVDHRDVGLTKEQLFDNAQSHSLESTNNDALSSLATLDEVSFNVCQSNDSLTADPSAFVATSLILRRLRIVEHSVSSSG
jgi:hypothetical protein